MPKRDILVVAVDGLRASALGAYGNTLFPTPALDQFAADCFLLDWCYAPSVDLAAVYRALWQSRHPARAALDNEMAASLPRLLSTCGYSTTLVTDEPAIASLVPAADFDDCVQLADTSPSAADTVRANEVSQTLLAQLLAAAADVVARPTSASRLIWVHARGMYGPWDAPLVLQRSLLDEGDPPPAENLTPPDLFLTDSYDPDVAFRYGCAYAAQAMVLDACWTALFEAVQATGHVDEWLIMLLGARGYPLGEHRRVGGFDPRLYGEQLHVPWLIRFPDGRGRLARSGALVSHLDLRPTLVEWTGGEMQENPPQLDGMSILPLATSARIAWRDSLISVSDATYRAIRTSEWCLRQDVAGRASDASFPESPSPEVELFVRPDDRWEANDVAKLCPDVIETLTHAMDAAIRELSLDWKSAPRSS